jgi:hypothetical protein
VAITSGLPSLLDDNVSLGDSSDDGSAGKIIRIVLVGLLIASMVKNYVGREGVEPPKWLGALMEADVRQRSWSDCS